MLKVDKMRIILSRKEKKNFVKVYELVKPTLDYERNFRALMEKTQGSYLFKAVVSDLKLHHQQFCRSGLNLQTHIQRKTKSRERCRQTSPEKSKVPIRRLHRVSAQFWHARRRKVFLEYFLILDKHIFKYKLINKSQSRTWASPLGEFSWLPLRLGLVFYVISLFCSHRTLDKHSLVEALCL